MPSRTIHHIVSYFIASVWLINGLFCKVLNGVPRHELIVAEILGKDHSRTFTLLIGVSEIVLTVWILIRIKTRLNAITQIGIVTIMTTLEFILVPELLLWGRLNALFAFFFVCLVYYNEFHLKTKDQQT
jgi:hypothetical protein